MISSTSGFASKRKDRTVFCPDFLRIILVFQLSFDKSIKCANTENGFYIQIQIFGKYFFKATPGAVVAPGVAVYGPFFFVLLAAVRP